MKKFSKRLLTFVLACAMVFGLSGMTAFADVTDEQDTQDAAVDAEAVAESVGAVKEVSDAEESEIATLSADDEIATLASYTADYSWYGDGSATDYTITSAAQLEALSEIVSGISEDTQSVQKDSFEGKTITLEGDANGVIEMNATAPTVTYTTSGNVVTTTVNDNGATAFTPIGTADSPFLGTFDGNGVTISNLYVAGDTGYLGLFGAVGGTEKAGETGFGSVENFNLSGVVYSTNDGGDYVGGVCGKLNAGGTIQNIVSTVDVEAPLVYNVGGIVGFAGTPTGDSNNEYSSNPSRDNTHVLCCGNEGNLVHGYNKVGGIVGEVSATVKYCYNNSWVFNRRSGRNNGVGGITGVNGNNNNPDEESIIAYCYNTGTISNNGYPDDGSQTLRNYAGIAGWGLGGDGKNEIYNCYNIGAIPVGYTYASIAAAIEGAAEVAIRNNYSGTSSSINNYSGASDQEKGIAVSDEDFKSGNILSNLGAYFVSDFEGDAALNGGYPILFWQAGQEKPTVTGLRVDEGPTKTSYDGEVFDPTGMVVIATYSNGSEAQILPAYATYNGETYTLSDGYTYDYTKELTSDMTTFTISYEGQDATVDINQKTLTELQITAPNTTVYYEGDVFNPAGMTFTAVYSDSSTKALEEADVEIPTTPLEAGQTSVTISYTEGDVTVQAEQTITVNAIPTGEVIICREDGKYLSYIDIIEVMYFIEDYGDDVSLKPSDGGEINVQCVSVTEALKEFFPITLESIDNLTFSNQNGDKCTTGDDTFAIEDAYLYVDGSSIRLAANNAPEEYWIEDLYEIDVVNHVWGDVEWTWADDYNSATATRTCEICGDVETVDATVTNEITTEPGERTAGVRTYTATATFSDDTTATDTKTQFIAATGSIEIIMNRGDGNPQSSELTYEDINAAIEVTTPRTFTYRSGNEVHSLEMPYVNITTLLDIEAKDFCCYHVTSATDGYEAYLPTSTCLYQRDDTLIYRTAVDESYGRLWVDSPASIEVCYMHNWSDCTWSWNEDYSEATVTATCHVDSGYGDEVCGKTEEVTTTDITKTTTATATKDGQTTYTATATLSDGQTVTDTVTVDTDAIDPDGYITIVVNGETMELANTTIDAALEAAETQTIENANGRAVTAKFVLISDLIGISEDDFTSYTVTASDGTVKDEMPTDTYLYWRDDDACYRTAVSGGAGSMWRDDPTTIEVVGFATPNKDELNKEIEEATDLIESDYTPESWDALQSVLAEAEAVSESIVATQNAVDEATGNLSAAISSLVPIEADKTTLQAEIAETDDLVASDYTAASWEALQEALIAAEEANADPNALQSTVDAAAKALQDAIDSLEVNPADKTVLDAAIKAAEALNNDDGKYTDSSWNNLQTALTAAKDAMADDNAKQSVVNEVTVDLVDAIANLEPAAKPAEVDKSVLNSMIKAAEALNDYKDSYTPESWQNMQDALKDAQDVADNPDATQDEVNEAASDLVNALVDLVPAWQAAAPDKDVLDAAVKAAEALEDYKDYYTEDSWNDLQDALKAAQDVAENDEATQDEINEAASDLIAALADLQPVSESGTGGETKEGLCRIVGGQLWGYYVNGKVDTSYTGFQKNENGTWYVENGYINFAKSSVYKDKNGELGTKGAWYYVVGNKVQYNFTGLAHYRNANGWWYIVNGVVDFSHNGVDKNQNGWWYVTGGKVRFDFTGLANYKNANGWWYIRNGKVDFTHNGVDKNKNGWWYVTGGKVRFNFTGLAHYKNKNGWWYITNGKVDFTYTGRASNQNGTWNVVNGKVQF